MRTAGRGEAPAGLEGFDGDGLAAAPEGIALCLDGHRGWACPAGRGRSGRQQGLHRSEGSSGDRHGTELGDGIVGDPAEMGSDSRARRWQKVPAFLSGQACCYGSRIVSAFEHVVCRPARSSRGSAEIDRMRPAPAPVATPGDGNSASRRSGPLRPADPGRGASSCWRRSMSGRTSSCRWCSPSCWPSCWRLSSMCMRRWHLGRVPAVIIAVLVALGIILSLGAIIGFQVAGLASDLPRYQTTIESKVGSLREGTLGRLPALLKDFGRRFDKAVAEPPPEQQAPASPSASAPPAAEPSGRMPVEVHEPDPTPVQMARDLLLPLLEPLATTGIVFVVLIFILMQREDLRDRMIRLFGSSDLHRTTAAMDDAARRLSRYFLTQLALNAVLRCRGRHRPLADRRAEPAPVGRLRGPDALRALYRLLRRGRPADPARRRGRSRLVHGSHDPGAVPDRRAAHGACGRAHRLRPEHGPLALRRRHLGDLLDLALGTRRACSSPRP